MGKFVCYENKICRSNVNIFQNIKNENVCSVYMSAKAKHRTGGSDDNSQGQSLSNNYAARIRSSL